MAQLLVVRLMGPPQLERDGARVAPPRGRKSWAVLAYVALAELPVSRQRLASLLFADAADPLGALRWTLAELRRTLGSADVLRDDPVRAQLPASIAIDAVVLSEGLGDCASVRGELLEGIDLNAGPVFESWLLVARRRLAGLGEGVLHDAALAALATGDAQQAAGLVSRALEFAPFEESLHELMVRCLAACGDRDAAHRHAASCELLFRRELGRAPDARVARAADRVEEPRAMGNRTAALGQLDAGRAAIDSGAVEPGMACLRMACAEARACGDSGVLARTQLALGSALVHTVRGRDEEGAALLHEALAMAESIDATPVAVEARRELGYIEVQAGRAATAGHWLARATADVCEDGERAKVLGVRGMALSDRAHYEAALELLEQSVAAAERWGDRRQQAWSLAILGRALLLRGQLPDAARALDRSLELIAGEGWIALQPLPEALRAEVALRAGASDMAAGLAERSFALGRQLGDPCWEGFGARATGMIHRARGEHEQALGCFREAVALSGRFADAYLWVKAYCLDALAAHTIEHRDAADAQAPLAELEALAARGDMRELLVRAAAHRARLGDPAALAALRPLAHAIANPALDADLAAVA
ncbi:MAG: tetratricopeptide repeat protein [Solirubrobacteraceae bacterium]